MLKEGRLGWRGHAVPRPHNCMAQQQRFLLHMLSRVGALAAPLLGALRHEHAVKDVGIRLIQYCHILERTGLYAPL